MSSGTKQPQQSTWIALQMVLLCSATSAASDDAGRDDALWRYGAYLDLNYPANFNSSNPHPWRSKLTTSRLSEFSPNMGMFYLRKEVAPHSRWGIELGAQAGYDTDGLLQGDSQLPNADALRYVSGANVSYLAPLGRGLLVRAGLIRSFIGYESFYAKDNPNYTRSWIADYSPYFLIGVGGHYSVTADLDVTLYLVSDYSYLTQVNNHPKYAGQISWRWNPRWQLTQNFFVGPEQQQTSVGRWRAFSDTILRWNAQDYSLGLAYDIGAERLPGSANTQALWTGTALFNRWQLSDTWAVAVRPELYWDPNGLLTGSEQFIKAVTATVEYKLSHAEVTSWLRLEYRYDNSTGKQGGFYGGGGINGPLVSGQSTVFLVLLNSLDAR